PALNVFIPLKTLQSALDLPGRANALLLAGGSTALGDELHKHLSLDDWNLRLRTPADRADALVKLVNGRRVSPDFVNPQWQAHVPDDLAALSPKKKTFLKQAQVREFFRKHRNYLSLESARMYLEPAVVAAARKAAQAGWRVEDTLVYVV